MPGRQSTGPSAQKKPKAKNQAKKRALNALAIAEQQDPGKIKVRRHRLGEIDQSNEKRKRDLLQEESEGEEGTRIQTKRLKSGQRDRFGDEVEGGSDSEGNEWTLGHVGSDDDSELDSDEALGESDEDRFEGFTFRGSSTPNPRGKSKGNFQDSALGNKSPHEISLDEYDEERELDEESDDFREDAVDLAAMLDDSDNEGPIGTTSGTQPYSNSDDEVSNTSSEDVSNDSESDLSVSDMEDDANSATKLSALHTLVSSMGNGQEASENGRHPLKDAQEASTPSEFGLNPRQKLTVKDLLSTVTDPQFKKSLKLLTADDTKSNKNGNGIPQKLKVPLAKRQQDRLDRSAAYEKSKETLNRWIDTVKYNRRAEHLSFPLLDPDAVAAKGSNKLLPTMHSKPLTSLESTIQDILVESGLATTNGKSQDVKLQEFEELQTNKLPIGEVQARRIELRKARDLLFREEIRARKIKKIKSKSYRRVHRRERERDAQQYGEAFAASHIDQSDSEQERKDRQRAEERMGARHRESKWAKGIKDSGRAAWDEDARSGVTEMAKREDELRRRIEGKNVNAEDDDSFSSGAETSDEAGDSSNDERHKQRLQEKLQQLDGSGKFDATSLTSRSTLSSMKFMQKAERSRKEQNDADVENLRRAIAGEEMSEESQAEEAPGRRIYGVRKDQTHVTKRPLMKRNEFEEGSGSENQEHIDPTTSGDNVEIIVDEIKAHRKAIPSNQSQQINTKKSSKSNEPTSLLENPWLSTKPSNTKSRKSQPSDNTVLISNAPFTSTPKVSSTLPPKETSSPLPLNSPAFSGFSSDSEPEDPHPQDIPLSNRDLIRQAFAGDEVVASFEAEKAAATLDEEEKIISTSLPGWGSWTGSGISKREMQRNEKNAKGKGREVVKIAGIKKEKRVDWGLEKVVVSERRVKKNVKYLASHLPHPFETRQQYERSLRLPVGPEWTTKETFQAATKPRVLVKQGVIAPMERPLV